MARLGGSTTEISCCAAFSYYNLLCVRVNALCSRDCLCRLNTIEEAYQAKLKEDSADQDQQHAGRGDEL
jgi:hypothetical protein